MTERPILFSGPMVNAILEGRKTQTRRVMKKVPCTCGEYEPAEMCNETPEGWQTGGHSGKWSCDCATGDIVVNCPYGTPGDTLWVRESIYFHGANQNHYYRADKHGVGNEIHARLMVETSSGTCKATARTIASIHMHKWACRLFLEIKDVRVERLQNISEEDAIAEGVDAIPIADVPRSGCFTRRKDFQQIWDSINTKKHPWESNPWVWIVEFSIDTPQES